MNTERIEAKNGCPDGYQYLLERAKKAMETGRAEVQFDDEMSFDSQLVNEAELQSSAKADLRLGIMDEVAQQGGLTGVVADFESASNGNGKVDVFYRIKKDGELGAVKSSGNKF